MRYALPQVAKSLWMSHPSQTAVPARLRLTAVEVMSYALCVPQVTKSIWMSHPSQTAVSAQLRLTAVEVMSYALCVAASREIALDGSSVPNCRSGAASPKQQLKL